MKHDMEEKEQEYLKIYKENQQLHSDLIEERSNGSRSGHRGSVSIKNWSESMSLGSIDRYKDDTSPKKIVIDTENETNKLKVQQLEKQIEQKDKQIGKNEQENILQRQAIRELEIKIKSMKDEQKDMQQKIGNFLIY